MPEGIRTTEEQFEAFREEAEKWVRRFGLLEWRVDYARESLGDPGLAAHCGWSRPARSARLVLNDTVRMEMSLAEVRRTAFHEVCELLLSELTEGVMTVWNRDVVEERTHRVIGILENSIWGEESRETGTREATEGYMGILDRIREIDYAPGTIHRHFKGGLYEIAGLVGEGEWREVVYVSTSDRHPWRRRLSSKKVGRGRPDCFGDWVVGYHSSVDGKFGTVAAKDGDGRDCVGEWEGEDGRKYFSGRRFRVVKRPSILVLLTHILFGETGEGITLLSEIADDCSTPSGRRDPMLTAKAAEVERQ